MTLTARSRSSVSPATWAPGAVVPGTVYRIIRPLGAGGAGEVYEAEHELLGVRRALKVLSRQLAERLRMEARALAQLKHPNLVEVNDLGMSSDGRVFFAMELLVGANLRDVLRTRGRFGHAAAIDLACEILDALHAAHERGMVHRDVKPENIWVQENGTSKLLDFGVAKALGGREGHALTQQGTTVGTPRYMAPEQAESGPIDRRVDVFAVGLVLWECLAGRSPYADLDAMAAMVAAVTRGIPTLGAAISGPIAPGLISCVDRATARSANDRHPTALALREELLSLRPLVSSDGYEVTRSTPSPFARTESAMTAVGAGGPALTVQDLSGGTLALVQSVRGSSPDATARLSLGPREPSPSAPPPAADPRWSPTPTAVPLAPLTVARTQPLSLPAGTGAAAPSDRSAGAPDPARPAARSRHPLVVPAAIVVVGFAAVAVARLLKPAVSARTEVPAAGTSFAAGGPSAEATPATQAPQPAPLSSNGAFDEGGDPAASSIKAAPSGTKTAPGTAPKPGGQPRGALPKSGL